MSFFLFKDKGSGYLYGGKFQRAEGRSFCSITPPLHYSIFPDGVADVLIGAYRSYKPINFSGDEACFGHFMKL
jgi:hypothetical protein